jgi:hypothetical protein
VLALAGGQRQDDEDDGEQDDPLREPSDDDERAGQARERVEQLGQRSGQHPPAHRTLPPNGSARVAPGQSVSLKPRALALETRAAVVDRVAPAAGRGDAQSSLTVYCRLEARADLRPGMTGHAKVYTGRRSVGGILLDHTRRTLHAELWW